MKRRFKKREGVLTRTLFFFKKSMETMLLTIALYLLIGAGFFLRIVIAYKRTGKLTKKAYGNIAFNGFLLWPAILCRILVNAVARIVEGFYFHVHQSKKRR